MLKSQFWRFSVLVGLLLWAMTTRVQAAEIQQNFRDVEIANVIEAVAKVTGQNFIIDPRVRGKVTLIAPQAMSSDALYQTLLAILNVHGFVAIPSGEVIKVVPVNLARDQLPYAGPQDRGEAWVTEVVTVNHVEAAKLVAILRPLVAREGHLVALADSNRLIVTDTVDGLNRIKAILKQIDINTHTEFEVIRPQYAPADELVRTLRAVQGVSGAGQNVLGARINFDERSNRIIVSGDLDDRLMVRALIAELDVPLSRDGSIQVVYLHYAKATDLVPILQQLASQEGFRAGLDRGDGEISTNEDGTSRPANQATFEKSMMTSVSIQADERMNAIVMSAPADVLEGLKNVIRQLDIRRAQVLIEAIIVELSEARAAQLGVDWAAFGASGVGLFNLSGNLPGVATAVGTGNTDGFPGRGVTAAVGDVRGNSGWGALINALRSDTGANILSTPTLLTLDNESAEIIVGREVPFRTGSFTTSAGGTNPFTTIERKSVGLKLRVKPQINQGNEVYLEIENEISDVLPGDTPDLLQTSKRELRTSVIVGDGDTIVLGGLLSERETDTRNEVLGLGSIPGLGALFRNQSSNREKVNLMIFLRPVIIRDQTMGSFHSRQKYGQMQEQQQTILRHSPSGLLEGLRPELPTLEQLDEGLATSSEKGVLATTPGLETVTEQSRPSPSTEAERRRDSSLEVLGF